MRVGNGVDVGRVSIEMNFGCEIFGAESPVLRDQPNMTLAWKNFHHFLVNAIKIRWILRFF